MLFKTNLTVTNEQLTAARQSIPNLDFKLSLNQPTGRFFYDPWAIKPEFKNTIWEELLKMLPENIGEARLISLKYGTAYQSHSDIDDRYHLNITGDNRSFLINIDTQTMYPTFNDGCWYDLNAGPRHSAVNFGYEVRVQLVVRKLLIDNMLNDPVKVSLTSDTDVRYLFDDTISPLLNRWNKTGFITEFTQISNGVTLSIEREKLALLKSHCLGQIKLTIL